MKTFFISLLLAVSAVAQSTTYHYETQSLFERNKQPLSPTASYIDFKIDEHAQLLSASSSGYISALDDQGQALTGSSLQEAESALSTSKNYSLTSISFSADSSFSGAGVAHIYIVNSAGNITLGYSDTVVESEGTWENPLTFADYESHIGVFSFTEGVSLQFGETYRILFTDATLTYAPPPSTIWSASTDNSPASAVGAYPIVQASFTVDMIPEPSTASLSLLALAGLLARRRRKSA